MMEVQDFFGKRVGRYLLACLLGSGAASCVYQAIDTTLTDSPIFAVKCIPKSRYPERRSQQIAEIVNHKAVTRCPNIMVLCDVIEEEGYFFLVLPLCEMDVFRAIWKEEIYWRDDHLIKKAFVEILDGVHACHNKGVYHRDLKPENIMCDETGLRIMIGDFGLSTDRCVSKDGGCGTGPYMSPESWDEQAIYTFPDSMDIWSLGVILFNMVTSQYPWEEAHVDDKEYVAFLSNKDYLLYKYPISESLNALLYGIWRSSPAGRLSIPAIRRAVLEIDTFYNAPRQFHVGPSPLSKEVLLIDSQQTRVASECCYPNDKKKGYAAMTCIAIPADVLDKVPLCCLD